MLKITQNLLFSIGVTLSKMLKNHSKVTTFDRGTLSENVRCYDKLPEKVGMTFFFIFISIVWFYWPIKIIEIECQRKYCNDTMVQINDDYYEDLDEDNFRKILINLKNNKSINKGSQIGRQTSHPKRGNHA